MQLRCQYRRLKVEGFVVISYKKLLGRIKDDPARAIILIVMGLVMDHIHRPWNNLRLQ